MPVDVSIKAMIVWITYVIKQAVEKRKSPGKRGFLIFKIKSYRKMLSISYPIF
jgi:hypothetical protein